MRKILFCIGLQIISCTIAFSQEDDAATVIKTVKLPPGFTQQLNIVQARGDNWESKMDLYLPPKTGKPTPVIINIHGGGWNHGTKEAETSFGAFFQHGFAVVNVEYRLVNVAPAPAAVEDCRCALLYVINNAKELNIDVNKIVVMGASAGGHLALLLGFLGNDHRFDVGCPGAKNVKVAAIIDKYGPADGQTSVDGSDGTKKNKSFITWMGGRENDTKFVASVSPITYVTKKSPPVFIVHGDQDKSVAYIQSVRLHEKLDKEGVVNQLMTIKGGQHGKFSPEEKQQIKEAIIAFLVKLNIANP